MDELNSLTVSEERLEDCRDVVEPDLQDLIQRALTSGFFRRKFSSPSVNWSPKTSQWS
ncbi:hypothetical protein ACOJBO_07175 [Rhizobium beringeri]